jgi:hypothetical protein
MGQGGLRPFLLCRMVCDKEQKASVLPSGILLRQFQRATQPRRFAASAAAAMLGVPVAA